MHLKKRHSLIVIAFYHTKVTEQVIKSVFYSKKTKNYNQFSSVLSGAFSQNFQSYNLLSLTHVKITLGNQFYVNLFVLHRSKKVTFLSHSCVLLRSKQFVIIIENTTFCSCTMRKKGRSLVIYPSYLKFHFISNPLQQPAAAIQTETSR